MQRTSSSPSLFTTVHPKIQNMCDALNNSKGHMMEADMLLSEGINMLKKLTPNDIDFQKKIDQIMVGTMVCVMLMQDTERKEQWYPYLDYYSSGDYSPVVSFTNDNVTKLQDDLSWCTHVIILPENILQKKYNKNIIYLQENNIEEAYITARLISKFEKPMNVHMDKSRILAVLNKYNLNFDNVIEFKKGDEGTRESEFINDIISQIGPVDAPLYSYIPVIGKHILDDKILPFNNISAAIHFPAIYAAYTSDYFERFKCIITGESVRELFKSN